MICALSFAAVPSARAWPLFFSRALSAANPLFRRKRVTATVPPLQEYFGKQHVDAAAATARNDKQKPWRRRAPGGSAACCSHAAPLCRVAAAAPAAVSCSTRDAPLPLRRRLTRQLRDSGA